MKRRIVSSLERWCCRLHFITHHRPWLWFFTHCPLADLSFRLNERWSEDAWKTPDWRRRIKERAASIDMEQVLALQGHTTIVEADARGRVIVRDIEVAMSHRKGILPLMHQKAIELDQLLQAKGLPAAVNVIATTDAQYPVALVYADFNGATTVHAAIRERNELAGPWYRHYDEYIELELATIDPLLNLFR